MTQQKIDSSAMEHPVAFHLLAKPSGATCNLDCAYCFFLSKEKLYPGSRFRMTDALLETYLRQLSEAQPALEVAVAWQGGEPTLMGLDFFRGAIDIQRKYLKPGMTFLNTIQTNGTLLDDEWAAFFKENHFLVGISIDGPREMHDAFRVDKGGRGTFDQVMRGLGFLQKHQVDYNLLTTLHQANADHPEPVYRFLRDICQGQYLQFIPIVERSTARFPEKWTAMGIQAKGNRSWRERPFYTQAGSFVSPRSITAEQYGRFLCGVFDEWVRRDVGRVYVQMFDVALGNWYGAPPGLCVHAETCGDALALEHNGDVYSCDHFVQPEYLLGNIQETHLADLVNASRQRQFGRDKRDTLPRYCQECTVRFACQGGCPKDRFIQTPDGEPGLNYLCAGYKQFFQHIDEPMRFMANELHNQRSPANVMRYLLAKDSAWRLQFGRAKPNDFCPCGSGKKFKKCHGREREAGLD